ncbi:MAG: gamma-glutamyl-gamma-aminobutyrate hydrolase family protein [Gemmatimonadetes bacterium]|nr:gamma-glutamyl-gamma-aminobutyrate hydrolase family protein [Gemmatimonadota bacterium]
MARPLIGITSSFDRESEVQQVDRRYVDAVVRAGGAPVLLPAAPEEALQPAVAALDGLVITGGNGIVEGLTGKLPEDLPEESPERTRRDRRALEAFLATERPVLGICFGMQLINAHLGGTICGDAEKELRARPHSPKRTRGQQVEHRIEVEPGTRLRELCGGEERPLVNSFHIQALAEVGAGLRVSSRSPDGLIESIETADGRVIGVQFHPERMESPLADNLLANLVSRARV